MPRDIFSDDPRHSTERKSSPSISSTTPRLTGHSPHPEVPQPTNDRLHPDKRPFTQPRKPEAQDRPRAYYLRDRAYPLRESEFLTLVEIATFRAVAAADLDRFAYGGDTQRMEREIRRLKGHSLISEKLLRADRKQTIRLFALTRRGARLAKGSASLPHDQALFHGFVKPREAKHDADLYRLYYAEAKRIKQAGGRVTRVVLDYELKRNLNRDLATLPPEERSSAEARERIAQHHGLAVVDGKIPIPDMRIEYDTAEMERGHLDLELATRNYRPRALAQKAKAGFSFYALREDASRLRRVLDEREITAEILSL